MNSINRVQRIQDALTKTFAPTFLEVDDQSARHKGHAGYREGEQTHLRVRISSPLLSGQSRIESHRAVYAALASEMATGMHALELDIIN